MTPWDHIAQRISEATGEPFAVSTRQSVGGGCINSAYRLESGTRRYFIKLNDANLLPMFEAEAEGLQALAASGAIRVPAPIVWGVAEGQSFLVMENLDLGGSGAAEALGHNLAQMHRSCRERFGWHRDNTIGTTPQPNEEDDDWIRFWREQRLGYQLKLAARAGHGGALQRKGEELMERFPALFADYAPPPSLLHGDLWAGNFAVTRDGEPVIFDPAVYYGDREADLAMTELFGGFGPHFYDAYNDVWPLDPGYTVRKTLYNLYHILNHLNLFGGGYGGQAESMMGRLLSELR